MIPEIGDKFIINWKKIRSTYPSVKACNFPELEFTIDAFSKSKLSVYYHDKRTNKKCSCSLCCKKSNYIDINPCTVPICIGVDSIVVTQKKLAIERDKKLKDLGI
jgi:hypothetical protein